MLTIYGCNLSGGSYPSYSSASSSCPTKPTVTLSENDVQEILLNEQPLTKSGYAIPSKATGYKFAAKSGERISLSSNNNICTWVYSPDNEIISGDKLPKTGKYIIQVSALKDKQKFDLKIKLLDIVLTQDLALEIIKKWYKAKPLIFAPPFDTALVEQLTTGKLYSELSNSDSSLSWLKKYNSYYTYNKSEIINVINFYNSGKQGYIKLRVFEELYLHTPKGINQENSGEFRNSYIYYLNSDNGVWKISSYEKIP